MKKANCKSVLIFIGRLLKASTEPAQRLLSSSNTRHVMLTAYENQQKHVATCSLLAFVIKTSGTVHLNDLLQFYRKPHFSYYPSVSSCGSRTFSPLIFVLRHLVIYLLGTYVMSPWCGHICRGDAGRKCSGSSLRFGCFDFRCSLDYQIALCNLFKLPATFCVLICCFI